MAMHPALAACLARPTEVGAMETVDDWWAQRPAALRAGRDPVDMAITGGWAADRVGWAFASGYQAALRALLPDLPGDALAAFCVTESEGNRPRDIRSTVRARPEGGWRLDGAKRWTTLGPSGTVLLVVAADVATQSASPPEPTPPDDRPVLRVLRVPVPCTGLTIHPMPATRFVPEVPHASLTLDAVALPADALLPGDGYAAYVKPFRTLEDIHVTLAVMACLLREAQQRQWPAALREQVLAVMGLLAALADDDPRAPALHLALSGALQWAVQLREQALAHFAQATDAAAQRWLRDAALFGVADGARRQRALSAWRALEQTARATG